jgi:hypothetical protein
MWSATSLPPGSFTFQGGSVPAASAKSLLLQGSTIMVPSALIKAHLRMVVATTRQ